MAVTFFTLSWRGAADDIHAGVVLLAVEKCIWRAPSCETNSNHPRLVVMMINVGILSPARRAALIGIEALKIKLRRLIIVAASLAAIIIGDNYETYRARSLLGEI